MVDKYHDPKGGLSAEGRKKFKKDDGANLKPGVKSYDSASTADKKRWISWAKRFAGNPQPLTKPNGEPTNYALMFQAWGRPIPKNAADVKATYDLAVRRGNALEKQSASSLAAAREAAAANPLDKKLYDEVVAAAKKKFAVYPSFYANVWVQQEYRKRGGKFAGGAKGGNPFTKSSSEVPEEELTTFEEADPTRMRVADRPAAPEPIVDPLAEAPDTAPAPPQRAKAFVTEHAGKTLLTGPATTIPGGFERALSDNPHMLWMQGRLVGGETPNRNKALWTSGDLELGNATVAHGPLNWLHEARHVIGSIAGSRFVPRPDAAIQPAAESNDPHIVAAASIWRWIYPDEAMVVEQASELNQLWYSMECVAESVVCSGDDGCGNEISYVDYCTSETAGCEHLRQRSGIRRFANPTFLGAAVIVPPTRPGWADADARVMQQASLQAEKAFEQAGEPDIATSDFEKIVAQVLKFAQ